MKTIFIVYLISVLVTAVLTELCIFTVQKTLKYRGIKLCKGSVPVWVGRLRSWIKYLIPIYNIILSLSSLIVLCSKETMDKSIEQIIEDQGIENF